MGKKQSKNVVPNQSQSARGTTQVGLQQPTPSGSNVTQQTSVSGTTVTPQHTQSGSSSLLALTPEEERYWRLVKVILDDMPRHLRDLFRSAFQKTYRLAWGDNSTTGKFFGSMVPKSKKRDKHITTTVEQGISEQFDPTVLFFCLLYSGTNLLLPGARKKESRVLPFYESERVDQLREQRNAVAHATTPSLSEADFHTRIQEIEDIYTQLQWDQTQLKEAAYSCIWPVEYNRLQGKIDVEKARIDAHEQRLQDLQQGQHDLQQGQQDHEQRLHDIEKKSQPQQDREKFVKTVEDTVTKQIRQKYCNSHLTVQYSLDAPMHAPLDEMFVDLRLQKFETNKLPEMLPYHDVEEMQRCKQSSEVIQIPQLFDVLEDKVAPHNVLIRGKAGVGKTTFVKQMAKQWAEKKLWNDIKYLFVVTLRELVQNRKWTLADLLLGELTLSEEEKTVAINEICKHPEDTMVAIEGLDEFPEYKFSGKCGGVRNEEVDLNVLISGIIGGVMLPGAKVLVTSRPTDQLPSEVCHRVTEIYGFSEENIKKYVDKFSGGDSELQQFIRRYLDTNVNVATYCYIPVQCSFVCMCLADIHSNNRAGNMAVVKTITQLYVYAVMHLIRKLHPTLKNDVTQMDSEEIFNKVGDSIKKHAIVATRCTLSSPLRLILYKKDLKEISAVDRQSGFLDESLTTDAVALGLRRQCWSFTHLTVQEFLAAVGLLMGRRKYVSQLIKSETSVRQHEVLISFVVGLLCDPRNYEFMVQCLGSADNRCSARAHRQMDPHKFVKKLAPKIDSLKLATLVHEAQLPELVDIIPETIESRKVFHTEMMSLSWVMQQQQCRIIKLQLRGLDSHMLMQLCDGLARHKLIQELNLGGNIGLLKTVEAAEVFGRALEAMTCLRELTLDWCGLSRQTLTPVMGGLTRGGLQLEVLNLSDNTGLLETVKAGGKLGDTLGTMTRLRVLGLMDCGLTDRSLTALSAGLTRPGAQQLQLLGCSDNPLTDDSRDTFTRLWTQHPELKIRAMGCRLSPECGRQLKEEFGWRRFVWYS